METYICENVFVPLRAAPSHKSEMLSQILFGEKYTIEDKSGSWMKIRTSFDNFAGWIDADHLQYSVDEGLSSGHVLNKPLLCYKNDKSKMVLEPGCEVFNPAFEEKTFSIGKNIYSTEPGFNKGHISTSDSLTETAIKFINSPYIWGGRIPSGIDSSGFTQLVCKISRIAIPRDTLSQAEAGTIIDFIDEAQPGDLAFFDDERGKISHTGMIFSRGLIIHASGRVRIDRIDHQGIFRNEINRYSHHLRTIRRIK